MGKYGKLAVKQIEQARFYGKQNPQKAIGFLKAAQMNIGRAKANGERGTRHDLNRSKYGRRR